MLRNQWVMLDYDVILFVDYEKTLCHLFPRYKGGQSHWRICFLIRKVWLNKWLAATSFLQSQKMCCMSKIKGDRIFIQSLHQAMWINLEARSCQKKPFKTCYKCEKPDHFKRDCWVKVACHRCGKSGHIKPNCRNQKQMLYVKVKVLRIQFGNNAQPLRFLTSQQMWFQLYIIDDISANAHAFIDYNEEWIVGSGCSHHATENKTLLSTLSREE